MSDTLTAISQWIIQQPTLLQPNRLPVNDNPFAALPLEPEERYDGSARLGFIYQELCRRLFARHPDFELLADEVQLREGKQTLGAIDFLLKHCQQIEHWEVAIKFYLLKDGLWYGPDSRDRLDIKLARMLEHQLTMSQTAAFRALFDGIGPVIPKLLIQGRLYINPLTPEPVPKSCLDHTINQDQVEGYWCHQHQLKQVDEPLFRLDKIDWVAGNPKLTKPLGLLPADRTVHCQAPSGRFWMVVPDSWPAAVSGKR